LYLRIKFAALFSKIKSNFKGEYKGNQLLSFQKQQSLRKEPFSKRKPMVLIFHKQPLFLNFKKALEIPSEPFLCIEKHGK
jgi:hypothetical protein